MSNLSIEVQAASLYDEDLQVRTTNVVGGVYLSGGGDVESGAGGSAGGLRIGCFFGSFNGGRSFCSLSSSNTFWEVRLLTWRCFFRLPMTYLSRSRGQERHELLVLLSPPPSPAPTPRPACRPPFDVAVPTYLELTAL